jgi:hypothetical protein
MKSRPTSGPIIYVVGSSQESSRVLAAARAFPLVNRQKGEAKTAHMARVAQLVGEAIGAGGTHLVVPREQADWLGDHPWLADYFATQHELAEAGPDLGVVFRLNSELS